VRVAVVGGGEVSVVVLEGSGGSGGLKGVLLVVVHVLVEQLEPVVLVKVQALCSCMGSKDWSFRRSQMEVCHFAHNPTHFALTGACASLCAADG
jgi:hypothetical protein